MLQFFSQTPRGTYDNVLADAEHVRKLAAIDAIEAYNPGEITELTNYHPKFNKMHQVQAGDGMVWGTPTRFSFYAISYNSDHMSFEESSDLNSLFLPKFEGKVGIFDWYLPNMGNASLAVHPNKENPYDLTDDQLGAVRDCLLKLRPQVNMFGSSAQPVVQAMINGDVVAAIVGDLDIDLKLAGYTNMESTIPVQGGIRWQEVATMCKQSENKELALDWIKYMSQIIAHTLLLTAPAMAIIQLRLAQMPAALEETAWDLGANELQTVWRVVLPWALPGIAGGWLLAFTFSFDEFIIAWFVSGFDQTLPVAI